MGTDDGPSTWPSSGRLERLKALQTIRRAHEANRQDVGVRRALGVGHLVIGDVDAAVVTLEEGRAMAPANAAILSDLAAAYLTRGRLRKQPQDFALALDVAERALRIDNQLLEAKFNVALAVEYLAIGPWARRAWHDYAKVDSTTAWGEEARRRAERIPATASALDADTFKRALTQAAHVADHATLERLVESQPAQARDYVENTVIAAWSARILGTGGAGSDHVDTARRVVSSLARRDPWTSELLQALTAAESDHRRASRLADAFIELSGVRAVLDGGAPHDVAAAIDRTRAPLSMAPATNAYVELYAALASFHAARYKQALLVLRQIESTAATYEYRYLHGRALLLRGLIEIRQARSSDALNTFVSAFGMFEAAGETAYAASALTYGAEVFRELGLWSDAWQSQADALERLGSISSFRRRHTLLASMGTLMVAQHLDAAAVRVQQATLENAKDWGVPAAQAASATALGRSYRRLGERQKADQLFDEADRLLERIEDPRLAMSYRIETSIARADGIERSDAPGAIAALTSVITELKAIGDLMRLPKVYLALGRAHRAAGHLDEASDAWRQGIAAFEDQRAFVRGEPARVSDFDEAWELYEAMIELLSLEQHDVIGALCIAERARSRVLKETAGNVLETSGRIDRCAQVDDLHLRGALERSATLLMYVVLPDQLLLWIVHRDGIAFKPQAIERRRLQELVDAMLAGISEGRPVRDEAQRLHELLIAPAAKWLRDDTPLVVLPDGPLYQTPFAALEDRRGPLVARHPLIVAPSLALAASVARRPSSRRAASSPRAWRALIVGEPETRGLGTLPTLPDARGEAENVAKLYPDSTLLTGAKATRTRFIASLPAVDLVHFAGHSVTGGSSAQGGYLQLAVNSLSPADDRLYARELAAFRPLKARLVVLSSCSGARGTIARGEGAISLGRAFLGAGAGGVIAGLWDVADRSTSVFMRRLHGELSVGHSPAEALRRAQVSMWKEDDGELRHAASWAGFVAMGSVEELTEHSTLAR